jgi:hypothetical protein
MKRNGFICLVCVLSGVLSASSRADTATNLSADIVNIRKAVQKFMLETSDERANYERLRLDQHFPMFTNWLAQKDYFSARCYFMMLRACRTNASLTPDQYLTSTLMLAQSLVTTNSAQKKPTTNRAEYLDEEALGLLMYLLNKGNDNAFGPEAAELIPYLIAGLRVAAQNHLSNAVPKEATLPFLFALTGRDVGDRISGHEFSREPETVFKWWDNWWRENQDRHPIFDDAERGNAVYREAAKLDAKIHTATPDVKWEPLMWPYYYAAPPNHLVRMEGFDPIFFLGSLIHHHSFGSNFVEPKAGDHQLDMKFQFLTEPLRNSDNATNSYAKETIFSETLTNFGMKVTVDIYSTNTVLRKSLREALNR